MLLNVVEWWFRSRLKRLNGCLKALANRMVITTSNIPPLAIPVKPPSDIFNRIKLFSLMDDYQFSFEKLEVWQLARRLAIDVYQNTIKFPQEEKYLLIAQLRRAAISVASNLAEGTTRTSAKDKAHFTTVAFSSLMEVLNQLIIAVDLRYLTEENLNRFRRQIQTLSVKLSNLKTSQLRGISRLGLIFWSLFMPTLTQQLVPLH
jgi:four helix bundle protein